jgi:hypothetical protein
MLGALVAAVRDSLRALMRLLTHRGERERAEGQPAVSGVAESGAGAAAAPAGDGGWALPYEDPLVFPSATLKSVESRCGATRRRYARAGAAGGVAHTHARTRLLACAAFRAWARRWRSASAARAARARGGRRVSSARAAAELTPLRPLAMQLG